MFYSVIFCRDDHLARDLFSQNCTKNDERLQHVMTPFPSRFFSENPTCTRVIMTSSDVSSMTEGAQQAMRRTMEIFSETTRFALACNYSNKIIEPIQSRCAILRYTRLTDAQVVFYFCFFFVMMFFLFWEVKLDQSAFICVFVTQNKETSWDNFLLKSKN